MWKRASIFPAYQNPFAPSARCASLPVEEFIMKAMSFALVVLAASMFVGCAEEKPAKPTPDPSKPAAAAPSANAAPAPAKPAEKKDEGGW
jgi:hypothetical protein